MAYGFIATFFVFFFIWKNIQLSGKKMSFEVDKKQSPVHPFSVNFYFCYNVITFSLVSASNQFETTELLNNSNVSFHFPWCMLAFWQFTGQ